MYQDESSRMVKVPPLPCHSWLLLWTPGTPKHGFEPGRLHAFPNPYPTITLTLTLTLTRTDPGHAKMKNGILLRTPAPGNHSEGTELWRWGWRSGTMRSLGNDEVRA